MSSIRNALGGKSIYKPLKGFNSSKFNGKNIVLIVIDGLGYNYLTKYGKNSFLYKSLKGKITSVFPATTASAMTSFSTGVAPQQHGLTGWFMYLKEIGAVSVILKFTTRAGGLDLNKKIKYEDIYNQKSFFEGLKVSSFSIKRKELIDSDYSRATDRGAKQLSCTNINSLFDQIKNSLTDNSEQKFIFAYWDEFDWLSHKNGTNGKAVKNHFNALDGKVKSLAKFLNNRNTVVIISADHGLVNASGKRIIRLKDHPQLVKTLAMPLCGDGRLAYCYVKPGEARQFESYVKTKLKKVCEMRRSNELIKDNYYGLFTPNNKLKDRIGDYVLIMKDNYAIKDLVLGETRNEWIGHHGGMSEDEMFVPLVIIE
jgi:predicted AlkP superfamily pyrophosphatase or phosphodiesterase